MLASRIAAQAKGGEILVSSTLKQYTEQDQSFEFEPPGEHHFKGVIGEHAVYLVRWRWQGGGLSLNPPFFGGESSAAGI